MKVIFQPRVEMTKTLIQRCPATTVALILIVISTTALMMGITTSSPSKNPCVSSKIETTPRWTKTTLKKTRNTIKATLMKWIWRWSLTMVRNRFRGREESLLLGALLGQVSLVGEEALEAEDEVDSEDLPLHEAKGNPAADEAEAEDEELKVGAMDLVRLLIQVKNLGNCKERPTRDSLRRTCPSHLSMPRELYR